VSGALAGLRVAVLERRHRAGHRGALVDSLLPELRSRGASVDLVHAEDGWRRLDEPPPWDLAVLKSGSAAALHVAAAAEAWGIPCLNTRDATRLAQDKLASSLILQSAGLPIAPSYVAWLGGTDGDGACGATLASLTDRTLLVKAARGSQGVGLWRVDPGELPARVTELAAGPYLIMEWVPHDGNDLKVCVAGDWIAAIERPFPARTLDEKRGRSIGLPREAELAARAAGSAIGLSCFGCDFVLGPAGWSLVDINAFPGFKGADDAAAAIADEVTSVARGAGR